MRTRTRVIQNGVHPSLHIQYKNFDLKQYFKECRGLSKLRFTGPKGQGSGHRGMPDN